MKPILAFKDPESLGSGTSRGDVKPLPDGDKVKLDSQINLTVLTQRFRDALRKGVEGIIEAGRVLIEAKSKLKHGQFTDWVVRELRFGEWRDRGEEES